MASKQSIPGPDLISDLLPGKKIEFAPGQLIISQGAHCDELYYIYKGLVKLGLVSTQGRGAVLGIVGRGDFFGENCITGQAVYLTSATAITDCAVVVAKTRTVLRLIEDEPRFSRYFIDYLLSRNQRIQQNLIDQLIDSSEQRLAKTLLMLARYGDEKDSDVLANVSQDTLAEMIGTTRSRVNFFMNKFRKLGFIHYNGGLEVKESLAQVFET